jgi:drug/metabolite transporter (DMT)-like permease
MTGVGELAALVSAMSWGVTTVLVRAESRHIDVIFHNAIRSTMSSSLVALAVLSLAVLGLYSPAFGPQPWLGVGFLVLSIALTVGAGDSLYFLAVQRIGVARAMPISMSHPLLTALLAVALLGERVTLGLVGGLVLIPSGLYLVTRPPGRVVLPKADAEAARTGITMAFAAAGLWAVSAVMVRPALDQVDILSAAAIRTAAGAISVWLVTWRSGRLGAYRQVSGARLKMAAFGGAMTACGNLLSLVSVSLSGVARWATLTATAPLFAIPLSALALGEHVTRLMVLGTLLVVAGVALVVGA